MAHLTLVWPEAIQFSKQLKGRDLLLQFDRPFNPIGLDTAVQGLFAWLGDVRYGYDTLLLRANRAGTVFDLTGDKNRLTVFITQPPPTPEMLEERKNTEARLRFLKAKAMKAANTLYLARGRMDELTTESPNNVEFLGEFGTLEDQLGRWRHAIALYDRGLAKAEGEPNIIFAKALLHRNHARHVQVSGAYKRSTANEEVQRTANAELFLPMANGLAIDLDVSHIGLQINNLQRADGRIVDTRAHWFRGEVGVGMDHPDGDFSRLGLLFSEDRAGVALSHRWQWPKGATRVSAWWRDPYRGLVNSIADGGWRDRLELRREDTWSTRLRTTIEGSLNRYGLPGEPHAAAGQELFANLRSSWLSRNNLELSYTLDKERIANQSLALDDNGLSYKIMPVLDKETHLFSAAWFDLWTDYLTYNTVMGYSYDRISGNHGPSAVFSLLYAPLADLHAGVSGQRGFSWQSGHWVRTDQLDYSLKVLF